VASRGTRILLFCYLDTELIASQMTIRALHQCAFTLCTLLVLLPGLTVSLEAAASDSPPSAPQACARPADGAPVAQPHDLRSKDGLLKIALSIRASRDANGNLRYCYLDAQGNSAPTLRVRPGDMLEILLKNEISLPGNGPATLATPVAHDPCAGGAMTAASTNLHFHGLAAAPVCHQDETLRTRIEPGDPPFAYRVQIPGNQSPGLYWYHPHIHGFSEPQLLGGASGALIVEGIEKAISRLKGLPERVLVIRDEWMPAPSAAERADPKRPTKQLSINYVPVRYPSYRPAVIQMRPGQRELWRVLNASADTYLSLHVEFGGKRQNVAIIALDGVPLRYGEATAESYVPEDSTVFLPPATRAEFVVTSPADGQSGQLTTGYVYRGADEDAPAASSIASQPGVRTGQDDVDAARPLAAIVVSARFAAPPGIRPVPALAAPVLPPLSGVRPSRRRSFFFSERLATPGDPASATLFFITEEGHEPAAFDPESDTPNVTVRAGAVEDWTIENRSRESHTFHIHQLHFIVVGRHGALWEEPTLRDTVNVPAWNGYGRFPSLTLRMDFRDPHIIGTIPFHCHIAQHLDGGMMGTVRVEPAPGDPTQSGHAISR
jgi:FtsP/CotA-like multicopper oxidase with cupredoxin domain